MTLGALPHTVEVRTLAARSRTVEGVVDCARMPRLSAAIVAADGPARVNARFSRDEEGRFVVSLDVEIPVQVACQRCLQPLPLTLVSSSQLAALWNDEQAAHLPVRYDPLVTGEETDLWQVVEDDLLLALPPFSYHDNIACAEGTAVEPPAVQSLTEEDTPKTRENPFSVLAALKDDLEKDA